MGQEKENESGAREPMCFRKFSCRVGIGTKTYRSRRLLSKIDDPPQRTIAGACNRDGSACIVHAMPEC